MKTKLLVVCLFAGLLAVSTAGRSQGAEFPLPEYYGAYIVADGKLYSPDPKKKAFTALTAVQISHTEQDFAAHGVAMNVPLLPGTVKILVYAKGDPLKLAATLPLHQLSFVRRLTIRTGPSPAVGYQPRSWVAATEGGYLGVGETAIEMQFKPVKGQNEMVLAVPATPLEPGVYSISGEFPFAVAPVDQAATARCTDAALGGGVLGWRLSPCASAPAAAAHVRGTIVAVDAAARSFVFHPAQGADFTVKVNDQTKYTPTSKGKSWDDVKAGAKVSVWYLNDGTNNWARAIFFAAE